MLKRPKIYEWQFAFKQITASLELFGESFGFVLEVKYENIPLTVLIKMLPTNIMYFIELSVTEQIFAFLIVYADKHFESVYLIWERVHKKI